MAVNKAISASIVLLAVLAFAAQFAIEFSTENIACAAIILASVMTITLYLNWTNAIYTNPLSTFAMVGFCVTTQFGALIAQTVAGTAVIASLRQPLSTFTELFTFQAIAMSVHVIYRAFSTPSHGKVKGPRSLLKRLGLYTTPSSGQLWFMGCVGCIGFVLHNEETVLGKIGDALDFLAWAPFLIPLYMRLHGRDYDHASRQKILLAVYGCCIAVFGMAVNARYIMFTAVVTVGLLYLLAGMLSQRPLKLAELIKIAGAFAILLTAVGPLSDLATAMTIARASRGKISAQEMIQATIEDWRKPYLIAAYRAEGKKAALYEAYDEDYIENPILARFVETKFHDNALYFAKTLTGEESRAKLKDITIDGFWSAFPTPVLDLLGVDVKKADMRFSIGDYLVYLSRGIPLGGYKAGSLLGQGIGLFGNLFYLVYAGICLVLFWLMDLLSLRSAGGATIVSPLGLMKIWQFFLYGITAESLNNILIGVVRGMPQMLLVYMLVFQIAKSVIRQKIQPAAAHSTEI